MSDQNAFTIVPSEGSHLIFVTEKDLVGSRTAAWLVPHDNDEPNGDLGVLSDRDITVLRAFLEHATIRVGAERQKRVRGSDRG